MTHAIDTHVTNDVAIAAGALLDGDVVAFPTETVWGLGALATDPLAIAKIYAAKGRPNDNPLIVHVASMDAALALFTRWPSRDHAETILRSFAPGPITVIIPRPAHLPAEVSAGLPTVGLRIPSHGVAQALLQAVGLPVAAPSANASGRPSPTTRDGVLASLNGKIPLILDGPRGELGLESTVVDCTGATPTLLRAGAVSVESLRRVAPTIRLLADAEAQARSPGTRHRHYAPTCRVHLATSDTRSLPEDATYETSAYIGLTAPSAVESYRLHRICNSVEHYAHELFEFMRLADNAKVELLVCERVPVAGIGRALMDRLHRAARGGSSPSP